MPGPEELAVECSLMGAAGCSAVKERGTECGGQPAENSSQPQCFCGYNTGWLMAQRDIGHVTGLSCG